MERKRLRSMTNVEICENNGLKSLLYTNTIDEVISKKKIKATMQIIAKALTSTLGPDGSTTILQDREMQHSVTKDGLDVISSITFQDELARTILDLVKTISSNQVRTVGDGSTSVIIVANSLYQQLTDPDTSNIFEKVSPKTIVDMIETVSDYLEQKLKEIGTPVSEDLHEIEQIASIAMNNDYVTGKLMRDVYRKIGKYGFVTADISDSYEKDTVDYKHGISWKSGYIDPIFAEKYDDKKIEYSNPRIFIITSDITASNVEEIFNPLIAAVCGRAKEKLLIVANNISDEAKNYFANVRMTYKLGKPELDFTVVDIDQVLDTSKSTVKDLAALCGCEIFNKNLYTVQDIVVRCEPGYIREDKWKFVGKAIKSSVTKLNTEIVCDDSCLSLKQIENKNLLITDIKNSIDVLTKKSVLKTEDTFNLYDLKYRLSNLENLSALIHVGGKTYQERKSRQRLIEDATLASKSALMNGYIVGGNITVPKIINSHKKELTELLAMKYGEYFTETESSEVIEKLLNTLKNSFLASYRAVLENSYFSDAKIDEIVSTVLNEEKFYNLKTHKYEPVTETKVINSTDTDIQIMRLCFSLITLLATSNQVITLNCNLTDQVK